MNATLRLGDDGALFVKSNSLALMDFEGSLKMTYACHDFKMRTVRGYAADH